MRILATGGMGVVGSALVTELHERGHEMWVCDLHSNAHLQGCRYVKCDVGQYRQVERLFEMSDFDYVYHLAAEFGRWNGEDFYENLWRSNVVGTKNVLRMQEKKHFRMVFFSSSEIYGDYGDVMSEDVPMKAPLRQMNDYAITKWANELQVLNSEERFGTETVRVRLFNNYGPGETFSEYRSVICQFVYKALHGLPYRVYLNHHRSSVYIDDTVRTLANILDRFEPGEVYNIAGDEYHDIKSLSDMILDYIDRDDSMVEYVEAEEHNTRDKKADITKAKRDLDHRTAVTLREGIPRTIEWQKKVYRL